MLDLSPPIPGMYNNVGLSSARGSGTSGHIQKNLSQLKQKRTETTQERPKITRKPNPAILDHESKRLIEIKCIELRDELEEKGMSAKEIEERVNELRMELNVNKA